MTESFTATGWLTLDGLRSGRTHHFTQGGERDFVHLYLVQFPGQTAYLSLYSKVNGEIGHETFILEDLPAARRAFTARVKLIPGTTKSDWLPTLPPRKVVTSDQSVSHTR